MSNPIERFQVKPIPKKKKDFTIKIASQSPDLEKPVTPKIVGPKTRVPTSDVGTIFDDTDDDDSPLKGPIKKSGVEIKDKTSEGFDMDAFKKLMETKGMVIPKVNRKSALDKETVTIKKRRIPTRKMSTKLKIIDDNDDDEDKPKIIIKKTRKKPRARRDLTIIEESDVGDNIEFKELKERLPKDDNQLIKASSYYMNNRKKFMESINQLFYPYKIELESDTSKLSCESRDSGDFNLLTHQKIVRDYLQIYTPYRGLLLYHGLGSGKTCSSIAIAEGLKDDKQVIVMTPASLRMNYIEELKKCGDLMYKKEQFWEFVDVNTKPQYVRPMSQILNISEKFIRSNSGAWFVNTKKSNNYETLSSEEKKNLDGQLNEMINSKYRFINYNGLRASHVDKLSDDGKKNPFHNKVVIIDEAHNFISRIVNKMRKTDSISMRLYDFLLKAKNCKVIFLSGTPIINYPNEVGIMFNILRGYIKSWHLPLNVKTGGKIDQEYLRGLFAKYAFMDYLEYRPSSKTMIITKNPFGFVNSVKSDSYRGVKTDSRGQITDDDFIIYIIKTLSRNGVEVLSSGVKVELNKALPDSIDDFKNYFVEPSGELKNMNLFKRRIIGLSSYFRSAQEQLMPKYNENKDYHLLKIPMSDYQFGIYEAARQAERKQESNNAKRAKKAVTEDVYDTISSTYRIFSRAFCNFVFPPEMKRPMPTDDKNIEDALKGKIDEDLLDKKGVFERLDNPDGRYTMDDMDALSVDEKASTDDSYDERIKKALAFLKENEQEYLMGDSLKIYSGKFAELMNIIQETTDDEARNGLHLIYSQFRTMEGVGIMKLILEANGYAQFKIKQERGKWSIDIADRDLGKPTFALYTGTETPEEKEIIRNIFNSTWNGVPKELLKDLQKRSLNNFYGEIIKIIMITASGAEGISLRNVRHVHLIEPYWHPVRTEQVIGRARRICSHQDLPQAQRNIEVYMYLMTFTEEQKTGDQSIELRLNDLSKLDKSQPLTSDEALYEISRIKENINKQLLTAIKETSIDCSLHSESNSSEELLCYSFGDVDPSMLAYTQSYENEQTDKTGKVNKKKISWKAQEFSLNGKKYMVRLKEDGKTRTNKVYDYFSFQQAKKNPEVNPEFIGILKIEKDSNGKTKAYIKQED